MPKHRDITGIDAVHPFAYMQARQLAANCPSHLSWHATIAPGPGSDVEAAATAAARCGERDAHAVFWRKAAPGPEVVQTAWSS